MEYVEVSLQQVRQRQHSSRLLTESLQQVRQRQHSGRLLIESLQQVRQRQHSGRALMEMKATEAVYSVAEAAEAGPW